MKDFSGTEYKVGDYVFCAVHAGCSSVDTYAGRVIKINQKSIRVVRKYCTWRDNPYGATNMLVPERHLIIPEDLALKLDPGLKDYNGD